MNKLVKDWADDDVPWWYNERTSVGFFAAAVWKKGGKPLRNIRRLKNSGPLAERRTINVAGGIYCFI